MDVAASRPLAWGYLGRLPFRQGVELQEELRRDLAEGAGPEHLLLLEHPHVFTLGRRARRSDVLATDEWLASRGVEVAECDRGGQVTYHGPGQLVGYPILDLDPDRRDVRRYVRDLQEVLVRTLAAYGVPAEGRVEQPAIGVWAGGRKIASIGVHLRRWLTTHGFALNVTTDLGYFSSIVPCGLPRVEMASIESETGARPPLAEVAAVCAGVFAEVFGRRLEPIARESRAAAWATAS